MNTKKLTDDILAAIRPKIEQAIKEAFDQGGSEMLDRIFKAAAESTGTKTTVEPIVPPKPETGGHARAPRGRVGKLIETVLTQRGNPGLRGARIEECVLELDDRIARKSVGNELRRFKGKRYRQDEYRNWFLISDDGEKETAGHPTKDSPAESDNPNQGTSNGPALV